MSSGKIRHIRGRHAWVMTTWNTFQPLSYYSHEPLVQQQHMFH